LVCYNQWFDIQGSGGHTYHWTPEDLVANPNAAETAAKITGTSTLILTAIDEDGCADQTSFTVNIFPRQRFWAGPDYYIEYGGEALIESESNLPITWESSPFLSCLECNFPIANPLETTTFYASTTSDEGCMEHDSLQVKVLGEMY